MYENTFSTDREQVVRWALQNMRMGVKYGVESVSRIERELVEAKKRLASEDTGVALYKDAVATLQAAIN